MLQLLGNVKVTTTFLFFCCQTILNSLARRITRCGVMGLVGLVLVLVPLAFCAMLGRAESRAELKCFQEKTCDKIVVKIYQLNAHQPAEALVGV